MMTAEECRTQIDAMCDGVPIYAEGCSLTTVQKADIEAAGIMHKWLTQIPIYLNECEALRAENPAMGDRTIRALAKTALEARQ